MSNITYAPHAHPFELEIVYPESLSRFKLLLKTFLGWLYVGFPHGIALYIYGILASLAAFVSSFAILITGSIPRGLFDFIVGYHRWNWRVAAYMLLMVDDYPPFSTTGAHSLSLEVGYPERLSRGLALLKLFLGWLYVGIPHGIALAVYAILAFVVLFLSWWVILFTGRIPRGFFDFVLGFFRWSARVNVYLTLLRDEYPPFHGRPA